MVSNSPQDRIPQKPVVCNFLLFGHILHFCQSNRKVSVPSSQAVNKLFLIVHIAELDSIIQHVNRSVFRCFYFIELVALGVLRQNIVKHMTVVEIFGNINI